MRPAAGESRNPGASRSALAAAAIAGGALWAALAVPAGLESTGGLSYDAFNRLLALPVLLMLVGLVGVYRVLVPACKLARTGFATLAFGFVLLLAGNIVEFWGSLVLDKVNAHAAHEAGASEHWVGSDIGWMLFGPGMLISIVGGVLLALALRPLSLPRGLKVFVGLIGVGILAANLFGLGSTFVSAPVFVLYGIGWIALGRRALVGVPVLVRD